MPVSRSSSPTLVTFGNVRPVASIANLDVQRAAALVSVYLLLHPKSYLAVTGATMRFLRMSFVRIIRLPVSPKKLGRKQRLVSENHATTYREKHLQGEPSGDGV
jgi:hypothetical protein